VAWQPFGYLSRGCPSSRLPPPEIFPSLEQLQPGIEPVKERVSALSWNFLVSQDGTLHLLGSERKRLYDPCHLELFP